MQAHVPSDLSLGAPPPEVTPHKVLHVGRVYRPEVALAIGGSAALLEAIVQRQIVPDTVAPAITSIAEIGIVV